MAVRIVYHNDLCSAEHFNLFSLSLAKYFNKNNTRQQVPHSLSLLPIEGNGMHRTCSVYTRVCMTNSYRESDVYVHIYMNYSVLWRAGWPPWATVNITLIWKIPRSKNLHTQKARNGHSIWPRSCTVIGQTVRNSHSLRGRVFPQSPRVACLLKSSGASQLQRGHRTHAILVLGHDHLSFRGHGQQLRHFFPGTWTLVKTPVIQGVNPSVPLCIPNPQESWAAIYFLKKITFS